MSAKINLKVTGVKGGEPSYSENKGRVVSFVGGETTNSQEDYICIDAFEGFGESYKRRNECEIEVSIGGKKWVGTPSELIEKLTK